MQFRYWQSARNSYWYWHFLDASGAIRVTGHQAFYSGEAAVNDIKAVHALWGGTRQIPINLTSDPNA